ncbi:unnamed protein product [Pleuronectes platessa]|uniref:Uncharacterized protein n=1 Tax=Pleuronectes platessa TaxID=8262 RepID=A0A9N7UM83_PLEPL|nr:unnamed protein product [Pleuronectes platessa]
MFLRAIAPLVFGGSGDALRSGTDRRRWMLPGLPLRVRVRTACAFYRVSHEPLLMAPTHGQLASPRPTLNTCRTSNPTDASYRQPGDVHRPPPYLATVAVPPVSTVCWMFVFQATTASPDFFSFFSYWLPNTSGPMLGTDPTMVQQSSGSGDRRTHRCMSAVLQVAN